MSTIDEKEVEKFSKIADEWWNESGKFKPLHKFNPIRLTFFRAQICQYFQRDEKLIEPFSNLKILDIGCGGGLIAEPLCRMGADVYAIDASEKNIEVAKIHAQKTSLNIDYQCTSAEELVQKNQQFDVVLALEIIEHVADVEKFVESCAKLVKPNGLLMIATLNRTAKSLLMAKFGVEYILRWLPIGTHDWRKFLKPSEIESVARRSNLKLHKIQGFCYNIFKDEWNLGDDLSINYCLVFNK
ncbi:MAG: bifunctional 2-polyprenyl-6-hydroxyphenol methylase/3-demethylubiquinol 3-O-methyltransferase UbiG [Proteobacteria bacterium]|nr:bifunctional 2-polyprenyl-6-hydroxyphenol methylase/3-demethylubiquinol 3-O-methyltransferase UbiG [Pseudomonadota bacterium]NCA27943.1 bifunctional 2-polyprenyl-6-hydroxyphenol methylase/3-demethylubiquinol 3-O-methyltransferase UbiG [Pseudomonadota bacterium]